MSTKKRILNILFWSVISAAFIGPGTITTAASSGASFGTGLLWALVFSTLACIVLQEAASRISITTGSNLGQSIARHYGSISAKRSVLYLVPAAIITGAAAYEMGNMLGAVEGIKLLFDIPSYLLVLIIATVATIILAIPSLKIISTILGMLVVIMGTSFLVTAIMVKPDFGEIIKGAFIPSLPGPGAGTLVLALIGTTIVPYNLFLGSGLSAKGQSMKEMRFGLFTAILLGGIFSMAVLLTGAAINGSFSFNALSAVLEQKMGTGGKYLLAFGLFAAGFTSAVTAPLATAVTLKSIFGHNSKKSWSTGSRRFRATWFTIVFTGTLFASLDIKPVPAIILAQALNGFLLPFVSIFLYIVIIKRDTKHTKNTLLPNILMLTVIYVTLILGINSAVRALLRIFGYGTGDNPIYLVITSAAALIIVLIIAAKTRNHKPGKRNTNRS